MTRPRSHGDRTRLRWGGAALLCLLSPVVADAVPGQETRPPEGARGEAEATERRLTISDVEFGFGAISAKALDVHTKTRLLAVCWQDGRLDLVSLETGRRLRRLTERWIPSDVRFLEHGDLVASVVEGPELVLWETRTGKVRAGGALTSTSRDRVSGFRHRIELSVSPEKDALAAHSPFGEAWLATRYGSWELRPAGPGTPRFRGLAWGPGGRLYGLRDDGHLVSRDVAAGAEWTSVTGRGALEDGFDIAVSPSGSHVVVLGERSGVAVVEVEERTVRRVEREHWLGPPGPFSAGFSPSGDRMVLTGGTGHVWMLSMGDLSETWEHDYGSGTPFPMRCAFVDDGKAVFVAQNAGPSALHSAVDGSNLARVPCGPGSDYQPTDGGVMTIAHGKVVYTPFGGDGWAVLFGRSSGDVELVVASDGRFDASNPAVVPRCRFTLEGERRDLSELAGELHDPGGMRALLRLHFAPE